MEGTEPGEGISAMQPIKNLFFAVQALPNRRRLALRHLTAFTLMLMGVVLLSGLWVVKVVLAGPNERAAGQISPVHPTFSLLDENGLNVLDTGRPVSTMQTCGACHDTEFIASHTSHAGLGIDPFPGPGEAAEGQVEGLEMNCFLCHTPNPNNPAREEAIGAGRLEWASTATLSGSGIVEVQEVGFRYLKEAFDENGELLQVNLFIQDPTNENCGQCHGTVHTDLDEPFLFPNETMQNWRGALTGQVISPQRLSESGLNLVGKDGLVRSFDLHAERGLNCTDCHYSLNNPVYYQGDLESQPSHLKFDPRRLELGEYLKQPVHDFAHGADSEVDTPSMRRCESCHSLEATHKWLPYKERHAEALSCESCHIPKAYGPALEQVDWTSSLDGIPRFTYRGTGEGGLIAGYSPILMARLEAGGARKLAPYNLVTTWYWVSGEPARPVALEDLQKAFLTGREVHPDLLDVLDEDKNGSLEEDELILDEEQEVEAVAARLKALGHENPRITGEVRPYSLNHGVTGGEWAVKDCKECHSRESRLEEALLVASSSPAGGLPETVAGPGIEMEGELYREVDGRLFFRSLTNINGLYVLGNDAARWVDRLGGILFLGVLLGVLLHSSLRLVNGKRRPARQTQVERVYMYGIYERFWHWLQTFTILGLLFTGLIIHKPDTFSIFSFRSVVLVHNILSVIVVLNAALSLFYHLVSGEIRQFLPRPVGLFDQLIRQGLYYLRGIFKGEPHPFEKTTERKLNPLQQLTYFGLLNVLLPLQVVTGALMWGVQRWPDLTARLGGLPFLAPFHSLIAWLLAAFIVGHIYLTTTGTTPSASIQAMMLGWDALEIPVSTEEGTD